MIQRIKITSLVAPHGRTFETLRVEYEKGIICTVESGPDETGYYLVNTPTQLDGKALNVHRSMIEPTR